MTPKFELGRDLCTMHPKFHHPMFTRSKVIVWTNKQTDAAENIQLCSLRHDVGFTEIRINSSYVYSPMLAENNNVFRPIPAS